MQSNFSVWYHPLISQDFCEAFNWYEAKSFHLAQRFSREVFAKFDAIEEQPNFYGHAFSEENYRFARLRKFPYLVIFRLKDGYLDILGLFHTASNPQKWRR